MMRLESDTIGGFNLMIEKQKKYVQGKGIHILYESVAKAVCNVRASVPLGSNWSEDINADYQHRGEKNK